MRQVGVHIRESLMLNITEKRDLLETARADAIELGNYVGF